MPYASLLETTIAICAQLIVSESEKFNHPGRSMFLRILDLRAGVGLSLWQFSCIAFMTWASNLQ